MMSGFLARSMKSVPTRVPRAPLPRAVWLLLAAAAVMLMTPPLAFAQAQPRLPQVELTAGIHLIRAEVADQPMSRQMGLMFREKLGPNEGMLFVFTDKSPQCFWMKNTKVPLTIAFIADDGAIVNLADMKPMDEASHCSAQPVRYALEMEQGWFAKRGVGPGATIGGLSTLPPAR